MDEDHLQTLLKSYQEKKISQSDILKKLRTLPFEDLDFAKVDHHRALRGFPEVVYCPGKTLFQITSIFKSLHAKKQDILLTKANKKIYLSLKKIFPQIKYHFPAQMITFSQKKNLYKEKNNKNQKETNKNKQTKKTHQESPFYFPSPVLILTAGTADIPIAEEAAVTLEHYGVPSKKIYDVGVAGLHRLLAHLDAIISAPCIIVLAGMDGALPSVVAGLASCPVFAVPTSRGYGSNFQGVAPLLTMLNSCSPQVAVLNIDNGFGAGHLASIICKQNNLFKNL